MVDLWTSGSFGFSSVRVGFHLHGVSLSSSWPGSRAYVLFLVMLFGFASAWHDG